MRYNKNKTLFESFKENLKEDNFTDIVKDSYNHFINDLGKVPTLEDIYDDMNHSYEQKFFKDDSIQNIDKSLKDIKYVLDENGLKYLEENDKLTEETDNKEWSDVCKAFCKKIGAKLLFVNDNNFGYEDKDGKLIHMYADELENYIKHGKLKDTNNKGSINEAIEQKYEKSNPDYSSFMKDVKKYTGSYIYLFGGKVETEYDGEPVIINYFYYERPYDKTTYNLVVNVLTPIDSPSAGLIIQEALENEWESDIKYTKLSNKEIKDKILSIVSELDNKNKVNESVRTLNGYRRLVESTNKEIKSMKNDYYEKVRKEKEEYGVEEYRDLPEDVKKELDNEDDIISCIEMIHSILTYGPSRDVDYIIGDKYLERYIKKLGEEKVRELLANEIEEYKNATINKDVYTDSEGVTYNSVTFKDDLDEEDALSYGYDINTFIDNYEYPPEIESEEDFRNSGDSSYFTVVKNEREAERFNYHSDYWGSEEEYQNQNVELVSELESFIEDGSKMYFKDDDGTKHEFIITGVAIDRQYNSISHTKILISEINK